MSALQVPITAAPVELSAELVAKSKSLVVGDAVGDEAEPVVRVTSTPDPSGATEGLLFGEVELVTVPVGTVEERQVAARAIAERFSAGEFRSVPCAECAFVAAVHVAGGTPIPAELVWHTWHESDGRHLVGLAEPESLEEVEPT